MAKVAIQGGVKNYLGDQKTVGKVPIKWKSGPDHPETELAYITKAEKDLLLKKDLHNSLNGKPNRGPEGLMSLNGWGDRGRGTSDASYGGGNTSGSGDNRDYGGGSDAQERSNRANEITQQRKKDAVAEAARKSAIAQEASNREAVRKKAKVRAKAIKDKEDRQKEIRKKEIAKQKEIEDKRKKDKRIEDKRIDDIRLDAEKKSPFSNLGSFFNEQRQKQINKTARRNKYKTLQDLGQLPKDKLSKTQLAFAAMNPSSFVMNQIFNKSKVDEETDKFDIDSIREIASQTQYTPTVDPVTGKTTYGTTAKQARDLARLKEHINIGNRDDVTQEEFEIYMNKGKSPVIDNAIGDNNNYAANSYGVPVIPEEVIEDTTYDYHLGKGAPSVARDVTLGYLADGGRAGKAEGGIMELRARRAFGGIMDRVTGRKAYGLGSIFKSVKKAVGKVLSSDVGKLAIMGAGIYYGGGGKFKPGGSSTFKMFGDNSFFSKSNPLLFSDGDFNPYKAAALTTIGGALMGPAKVDQMPGSSNGESSIDPLTGQPATPAEKRQNIELAKLEANGDPVKLAAIDQAYNNMLNLNLPSNQPYPNYANGGRIGRAEGGLMDLGGMEKDYRAEGGFVPIGEYEKKDDVPARLSVNEFVMTADAVRGAGQGDIDKGAEIMENMMKNLENGGTVSEESQGNNGAQQMFETSERLGEIL